MERVLPSLPAPAAAVVFHFSESRGMPLLMVFSSRGETRMHAPCPKRHKGHGQHMASHLPLH